MAKKIAAVTLAGLALVGCTNSDLYSGNVYSGAQARQTCSVSYGIITNIRMVKIQGDDKNHANGLGGVAGLATGAGLGSFIGGGRGQTAAMAAVGIGGALIGDKIQDKLNQVEGMELEIRKDSGEVVAVVQKAEPYFSVGMRVRLAEGRGLESRTTVSPA